ncbi:MAG: M20/M25/M40 family metallo-hydrolase [Nitrososphaerales archaeon]|nr:M20/M25/M40 family metallo-hydrolase [Nitrososphaerales archaeon]
MNPVDEKFTRYVHDNMPKFAKDVMRLVSQPSVSAKKVGINDCAKLVEEMLKEIGAKTRVLELEGAAPLVYGEIKSTKSNKTVLFYNHYDVQPEEPLELWKSPPFKPEVREGMIFGRGAADDKGEMVSRLKLVETYMKLHGEPPCNVKFCFEGEEEVGSVHLHEYLSGNRDLFKADAVFWEFGETDLTGRPNVSLGMKGMIYLEFILKSLEADQHSSTAAVLPSAPWRLVRLLNLIKDENERILVPGWYDAVENLTDEEVGLINESIFDEKEYLTSHGAKSFLGDMSVLQVKKALVQRPTANIAGIWAGYQGPGSKTVLPKEIHCKMDFRLVPNQDPQDLLDKLRRYLAEKGFGDVEIELESMEPAARTGSKDPLARAALKAGEEVWGKKPNVEVSSPGTGPLYLFTRDYKASAISIGVSSTDSGMHGPNEHVRLDYFEKGILWFARTLDYYLA